MIIPGCIKATGSFKNNILMNFKNNCR